MVAAEFSSMVMASFIVDANNRVALFHALVFRFAVLICSSAMLSAATTSGQISMVSSSGSGDGAASSNCTFLLSDDPEAFSAGSSAGSFLPLGGGAAGCFGVNAEGGIGGVGGSSAPWSKYEPNSKSSQIDCIRRSDTMLCAQ